MKTRILIPLLGLILCLPLIGQAKKKDPDKLLSQGHKYYKEKTYKKALSYYQKYLKTNPDKKKIQPLVVKMAWCHYRLRQYSEGEKFAVKHLKDLKGTIWEARAYRALGQMRFSKPHWGYKKKGKITWGRYVQGGKYFRSRKEDYKKSLEYFQKGRTGYMAQMERKNQSKENLKTYSREWIGLDLELIQVLEYSNRRYYYYRSGRKEKASKNFLDNFPQEFSPKFNKEEKILFLFEEAEKLAKKENLDHAAALTIYSKGMYLVRAGRFNRGAQKGKKLHDRLNPLRVLKTLRKEYPKDEITPDAIFAIAHIYRGWKEYLKAKKNFKKIIEDYSKSKWASDSKYYIKTMEKERIRLSRPKMHLPGKDPLLKLRLRNVKSLKVTLHPFELSRFLTRHDQRNSYRNEFGEISKYSVSTIKGYAKKAIHQKTISPDDKGDHQWFNHKLKLPLSKIGAYLAVIEGQHVTKYQLVVISDLTLVQKIGRNQVITYAADSLTGKPVSEANVIIKERYRTYRPYRRRVDSSQLTSDDHGISLKHRVEFQGRGYPGRVEAAAWVGNRYALTGYGYGYYNRSSRKYVKFYTITDRPVYRPKQKVSFKIYARQQYKGQYKNLPSQNIHVRIVDPKGKKVFNQNLITDDHGAASGEITLKENAPLGRYRIYPSMSGRGYRYSRRSYFRVEEYKKPEFEVNVEAPSHQVQLGNKIKATIKAKYYFGAPVSGAKVSYRVQRYTYRHKYYPASDWDWLYGRGYGIRYRDHYYNRGFHWHYYRRHRAPSGEIVINGTGKTNEKGELTIAFDTEKFKKSKTLSKWDHRFVISANVTDESRRNIKGQGSVKVTRKAFYAYIYGQRGFYTKGDKGTFNLRTLTASGTPVATKGTLKFYEVKYSGEKNKKEELTLVKSEPIQTGKNGRASFHYKSEDAGRFRIVFEAKDKWSEKVTGSRDVWFTGKDFTGNKFKFGSIEILTDRRHYEEGDTAHIMINTSRAGAAVLLTEEVGYDINNYKVYRPKGKSIVINYKITSGHTPNFFLSALSAHSGQVHVQKRQVFVPPIKKMLNVEIQTDKGEYKPGEKAKVTVKTTDYKGNPISTDVTLAAVDQSVYYIQSEYTPEVRKYFYGSLRNHRVRVYSSFRFSASAKSTDNQPKYGKLYRRHGMPAGWYRGFNVFGADSKDKFSWKSALSEGGQGGGRGRNSLGGLRQKKAARAPESSRSMDSAAKDGKSTSSKKEKKKADRESSPTSPSENSLKEPEVRKNFSDTAFWSPAISTDKKGIGTAEFKLPDSLTTWRITSRAITPDTQVGQKVKKVVATKNLLIRLQAPRFFTERDEVVLSGVVHNYLDEEKEVTCKIELGGGTLKLLDDQQVKVKIKANGVKRIDWRVQAMKEGQAKITMSALTDEESDAQQMKFPVFVHGIMKHIAKGGSLEPDQSKSTIALKVPVARKKEATQLEVVLSPSLASAMLDALPYLSSYPYGCVEQTMSRFLPSVVTAATLKDLGIDLETLAEKRKALHAKHLASRRYYRRSAPTFSTSELNNRVQRGLARLYSFQHSDGGWGWWRYGSSDAYMTAYVAYGLHTANKAGYSVRSGVMKKAFQFLKKELYEVKNIQKKAYILFVMSHQDGLVKEKDLEHVYDERDHLNLYGKALVALAMDNIGRTKEAKVVCRNIMDLVKEDKSNNTAWFETQSSHWWFWYNSDLETNAFILKALSNIDSKNKILPKMVKWLLRNREGMRWRSTKTTAFIVYAMADYIKASGELDPNYTLSVKYQGKELKKVKVTKKNALFFDNRIMLSASEIPSGASKITIEKKGKGRLYYSAFLRYFSQEEDVKGAGHEIFIKRTYTKLTPKVVEKKVGKGKKARTVKKLTYERKALKSGDRLESGEMVEVKLTITAKNDYEYLMFEDRKPAGLEAVALKSGRSYAGGLCSNMELRDEMVVFFISWLQQGTHEITYKLRAEIPGKFHALPTRGEAMYAPRVKATSDEWRVEVKDGK